MPRRGTPSRTTAAKTPSVSKTTRKDQRNRRSRARAAGYGGPRPSTKPRRGKRSELKIKVKEEK